MWSLRMVSVGEAEALDRGEWLFGGLEERMMNKMFQPGFKPFNEEILL